LCDFKPVAFRRTMLGVPSKSGKIPQFRYSEGTIDFFPGIGGADPTLVFKANSSRGGVRETGLTPGGKVELQWKGSGGRLLTPNYASELSRALLKSALEAAWLDHGEMMLEPRFDHIREAILGEPRDGFIVLGKKLDPDYVQGALTYQLQSLESGASGMLVGLVLFGVCIATHSCLPAPLGVLSDHMFDVVAFTKS